MSTNRIFQKLQLARLIQIVAMAAMMVVLYDLWFNPTKISNQIDAKMPTSAIYNNIENQEISIDDVKDDKNEEVINIGEEDEKGDNKQQNDYKEEQQNHKNLPTTSTTTISTTTAATTAPVSSRSKSATTTKSRPTKPTTTAEKYVPPERVVHFDLKGAPPRVPYFLDLLGLIKEAGGTGILIEWEDMFPYEGELGKARNGNAYSKQDVKLILDTAKQMGLSVIPLVQIFGHMEWVLKLEQFAYLRDNPQYSTVICAAKEEAWQLIKSMIEQVITAHADYGIPYFHIGADEIFNLGTCPEVKTMLEKDFKKSIHEFMLWHIQRVAEHVKLKSPETRVLAWHDMLHKAVLKYNGTEKIFNLVEPVVWDYAETLRFSPKMWEPLKPFKYLWGGSSFKGADGPSRFYANPQHYLKNQHSWLNVLNKQSNEFTVRGIFLTGWSRFDHFAIMCEILPVSIPSLLFSLLTLNFGAPMPDVVTEASVFAECPLDLATGINQKKADCGNFTEFNILSWTKQLHQIQATLEPRFFAEGNQGYEYRGWLGVTNRKLTFSSSWYLQKMRSQLQSQLNDVKKIFTGLETQLKSMFFDDMVTEYLFTYVQPTLVFLEEVSTAADRILKTKSFPLRPFSAINETILAEARRVLRGKNDVIFV